MQSFSQFGFKVNPYFTTTQLQYEALKTNLEKVGHMAEKMPNGIGAIMLGDDLHWLTVCKKNTDLYLGIYNTKTDTVFTSIVYGYPNIPESLCNAFVSRLESYAERGLSMKHSKIELAWDKALQKEKDMVRNNQEER